MNEIIEYRNLINSLIDDEISFWENQNDDKDFAEGAITALKLIKSRISKFL